MNTYSVSSICKIPLHATQEDHAQLNQGKIWDRLTFLSSRWLEYDINPMRYNHVRVWVQFMCTLFCQIYVEINLNINTHYKRKI